MHTFVFSLCGPTALNPRFGSGMYGGKAVKPLAAAASSGVRQSSAAACRRSRRTLVGAGGLVCQFDSQLNFNPLDYLKVPRDQTHITLYPWVMSAYRGERMRRWLQNELCMTEAQARSVLSRCPSLADLDTRLAQRRLRQLDKELQISRGDAALLVLRHPQQLLPPVSDVVNFAVQHRRGSLGGGSGSGSGSRRPSSSG